MQWSELYKEDNQPTLEDMDKYIKNSLWHEIHQFLQETYGVSPKMSYSSCSMQKGWNIKYQKSGKSLCTLYPMQGFFIALVVIGAKENAEAELFIPFCCDYIKDLYHQTIFSAGGRWLMIHVTDANILEDTKKLIQLRVKPKQK